MADRTMDLLIDSLLDGDHLAAVSLSARLRDSGVGCEAIITFGVEAAMARLDAKCTLEEFNLLEIMLAGRAVMGVIKELYPPTEPPPYTKGTVVLGALEGDVHDLGKNVFKAVLTARRYRVVDCGKDCPVEQMIAAVVRESALAVSVSGLITTVIPQLRTLKERLTERGLGKVKVMAGGAALKQSSARSLRVDFVADTAFDGLHYLERIMGDAT